MVGIIFAFARSSLCLVLFSTDGRDDLAPRVVDGEACSPLIDDACIPIDIDITHLVMRSMRTSLTNFSAVLNSSDIHA
jgi:hypothetical protein